MKKSVSVFLALILFGALIAPARALEADFGTPEPVSLVIGGDAISGGVGFQKNLAYLTEADMEAITASASGESTYRLGLGDCFSELQTYSTFENHGTPVWGWRRVYGLDLKLLAAALGIDTAQAMSVTATAEDGMVKTLPDAFGTDVKRYTFDTAGNAVSEISPIIALFETSAETDLEGGGVYPAPPVLGGSADRVDNVFGYGQTFTDEVNACFWVKGVRRVRFGNEAVALTVTAADGKKRTAPVSVIAAGGVWSASFGEVRAKGVPLAELLGAMKITVPEGRSITAVSADGGELVITDTDAAFVAWQATDSGSAVQNSTALRLYCSDGRELAGLNALDITAGPELVSRGSFVLMLTEAFNITAQHGECFADVPEDTAQFGAISAAKALGIAKGCGNELFYPDAEVTRQEAAVLLLRTLTLEGRSLESGSLDGYSDADQVADWAKEAMGAMLEAGIMGADGGALKPYDALTLTGAAELLSLALNK